jgi:hypothetical protein
LNKTHPGLSIDDVTLLSDRFWDLHRDFVAASNGAVVTLLTIQYNLVAGTLAQYLPKRNDLKPLIEDILSWKVQ